MQRDVLLKVDQLRTEFFSSKTKSVTAVDKVSFDIYKGEILGLVGESGCGKSVTSLSVMQLLKDTPGKVTHGQVLLDGKDLLKMSGEEVRGIRGGRMSMIFQEPMSALNPSMRIDRQMMETIMLHTDKNKEQARAHAADMLKKVGIPDPARVLKNYPDPGPDEEAAERGAVQYSPHHPRPGRGGGDVLAGHRHVRGQDRGGGPGGTPLQQPHPPLYPGTDCLRTQAGFRRQGPAQHSGQRPGPGLHAQGVPLRAPVQVCDGQVP